MIVTAHVVYIIVYRQIHRDPSFNPASLSNLLREDAYRYLSISHFVKY